MDRPQVTTPEPLKDGWYTGRWYRYKVIIQLPDGGEVIAKSNAGTTGEEFEFCSVKVTNGKAEIHYAS